MTSIKISPLIEDNNAYIFECPQCGLFVLVNKKETNCCIFRHAVMKNTYQQIGPHTKKETCEKLKQENKVFGCAKPFRIILSKKHVETCGYI